MSSHWVLQSMHRDWNITWNNSTEETFYGFNGESDAMKIISFSISWRTIQGQLNIFKESSAFLFLSIQGYIKSDAFEN